MNEFESDIKRAINSSIDVDAGPRRSAPPFHPTITPAPVDRSRWVLPLAVAAVVAACVVGTVVTVKLAGGNRRVVPPASPLHSAPRPSAPATPTAQQSSTPTPSASATHPGTEPQTVTTGGEVGPFRFDLTTENEIRKTLGAPQATATGSFQAPGRPNYLVLGYGCSKVELSTSPVAGLNCRTLYFLNQQTHVFEAFWTTSPYFRTVRGTTVGTSASRASSLERAAIQSGCTTGISFYGRATLLLRILPFPGGDIASISSESLYHGVGLLFC